MAEWPYNTRQWGRLRLAKLARDPLCVLRHDRCCGMASQVDHVVPVRDGGHPWDWANLQSVCQSCHSQKTYHVDHHGQDVPVRGVDAKTGRPLDPRHWWNEKISRG